MTRLSTLDTLSLCYAVTSRHNGTEVDSMIGEKSQLTAFSTGKMREEGRLSFKGQLQPALLRVPPHPRFQASHFPTYKFPRTGRGAGGSDAKIAVMLLPCLESLDCWVEGWLPLSKPSSQFGLGTQLNASMGGRRVNSVIPSWWFPFGSLSHTSSH